MAAVNGKYMNKRPQYCWQVLRCGYKWKNPEKTERNWILYWNTIQGLGKLKGRFRDFAGLMSVSQSLSYRASFDFETENILEAKFAAALTIMLLWLFVPVNGMVVRSYPLTCLAFSPPPPSVVVVQYFLDFPLVRDFIERNPLKCGCCRFLLEFQFFFRIFVVFFSSLAIKSYSSTTKRKKASYVNVML